MEIFLYLKFRFYSFVFSNLSLYSVFSHFCFWKRTCDQKKSSECCCQFCSWIYPQIFDNHNTFQDIVVDEWDFTCELNNFFQKISLLSLNICHDQALFIDSKKAKISNCTYFSFIKMPNKLLKSFFCVLIRLYLIFFLCWMNSIWKKQLLFFREQIWVFASDLKYEFCLHAEFEYFNNLSVSSMKFPENYTATCYRVINDHPKFIDLT